MLKCMVESVCPRAMTAADPQHSSDILKNNVNKSSGKMFEQQLLGTDYSHFF